VSVLPATDWTPFAGLFGGFLPWPAEAGVTATNRLAAMTSRMAAILQTAADALRIILPSPS
jgi:hypothetical protein